MLTNAGGSRAALAADALLAPLANESALLLAVSGGPDSVALMLLAAEWSQRASRRIEVATVDHALRPESRFEAESVRDWARALGFTHHLLTWEGAKPETRLQERARDARYALLAACARAIDPRCAIVTAHHADDQAETILFRLTRGSGVAGLAGMAEASTQNGVTLLRPLLLAPKSDLEALCEAARHPFLRDPSNENDAFARVRLRRLSATLAAEGLDTPALLRLGKRAAQADEALAFAATSERVHALLAQEAQCSRLDARRLRALPLELLQRLLAGEIMRLCNPNALRLERLERAARIVKESLEQNRQMRLTLGGVSITVAEEEVTLAPAPPRRRPAFDNGAP
jgi:tRNA(Ile)-lysidine synthase